MEQDQLEQKLSWLDEERRRGLDAFEALVERVSELEARLKTNAKQFEDLSGELARISAVATQVNAFDDSLHKHRQEVSRQLEEAENRRESRLQSQEELRRSDLDALNKQIGALSGRLERMDEIEKLLETRRAEETRITRTLDNIEKSMQAVDDGSSLLQSSVRTLEDARDKGAAVDQELKVGLEDQRKRSESLSGELEVLDGRTRRIETQLAELAASDKERREGLESWQESQTRKLVDFERVWGEWDTRFEEIEKIGDELNEQLSAYQETFRTTKQLQAQLESTLERLERRINEVSEIQRLAEERFKQDWNAYQAESQNRWNTFKLTSDEQWREHERQHDRIRQSLEQLTTETERAGAERTRLIQGVEKRVRGLLGMVREWTEDLED